MLSIPEISDDVQVDEGVRESVGSETNSHVVRGPAKGTEPEFEAANDDSKLYLVSALSEYPVALGQVLGPLKRHIAEGLPFDDSLKIAPRFQGQLKEDFLEQVYTLSTTKAGRITLSEKIRELDLIQVYFVINIAD
jgi:hypothetical protein